jgi:outer membrane lipoprotein SlyB
MYRLSLALVLIAAAALTGCASTETVTTKGATTATAKESGEMVTGSRISRTSTDRLIKSTVQDKADEPVRSMGNVVGIKGS